MIDFILAPILAGLSAGLYCATTCIPFIAPIMVDKKRKRKENIGVFVQFISGRFLGYVLFGAVFGFLGSEINQGSIDLLVNIAMIFLALLLLMQVLGVTKSKKICKKFKNINIPILMGFLMGINICPPFLMSLTYVFTLGNVLKGILYFVLFFISTSVYFLPIIFLGWLGKFKEFRLVGKIAGFMAGIGFLIYGLYNIIF